MDYSIRSARRDDAPFLADMLVEAATWTGGTSRTRVDVLADEATRRYIAGWPRAGDLGSVAATADGERIEPAGPACSPPRCPVAGSSRRACRS
ncbi:hypothetical protein [Rathayibacter oskolensis]|uniref:hypothetical protein n=1 Tax=Rathayibacter oskolensis TaxID=1891671 RepID=UPI0034668D31